MKQFILKELVAIVFITMLLISCNEKKSAQAQELPPAIETPATQDTAMEQQYNEQEQNYVPLMTVDDSQPPQNTGTEKSSKKFDIDFSKMNYTMMSAQIFDMMIEPESYIGKTVKFTGQFLSTFDEESRIRFYSILKYDATACCQTGLPFIWEGTHDFPEDYPEELSDIEICGTLQQKQINGMDFFYIDTKEIKRL